MAADQSAGAIGPVWRAAIIGCGRIADSIEDEVADVPGWTLLPFSTPARTSVARARNWWRPPTPTRSD